MNYEIQIEYNHYNKCVQEQDIMYTIEVRM